MSGVRWHDANLRRQIALGLRYAVAGRQIYMFRQTIKKDIESYVAMRGSALFLQCRHMTFHNIDSAIIVYGRNMEMSPWLLRGPAHNN